MIDLRVEKAAADAHLLLTDGRKLTGRLFLSTVSPCHGGTQTVAELMAEPERMLPFHNADGDFLLIGKAAVAAAGVLVSGSAAPWIQKIPLSVRLAGGHLLHGLYLAEEGMGQRLSDTLNGEDPWLRLECDDLLFWVAKSHLVTVEPGDI